MLPILTNNNIKKIVKKMQEDGEISGGVGVKTLDLEIPFDEIEVDESNGTAWVYEKQIDEEYYEELLNENYDRINVKIATDASSDTIMQYLLHKGGVYDNVLGENSKIVGYTNTYLNLLDNTTGLPSQAYLTLLFVKVYDLEEYTYRLSFMMMIPPKNSMGLIKVELSGNTTLQEFGNFHLNFNGYMRKQDYNILLEGLTASFSIGEGETIISSDENQKISQIVFSLTMAKHAFNLSETVVTGTVDLDFGSECIGWEYYLDNNGQIQSFKTLLDNKIISEERPWKITVEFVDTLGGE